VGFRESDLSAALTAKCESPPAPSAALRDAAMIALASDCLLRISELCGVRLASDKFV